MTTQSIYHFAPGHSDGDATMADLLGGKGANNCEMANLGISVPEGIILPTTYCVEYMNLPKGLPRRAFCVNLWDKLVAKEIFAIHQKTGQANLWSVRSGARVSMPGMMDTVLNVGMGPENFDSFTNRLGEETATDCWDRGRAMFKDIVGKDMPSAVDDQFIECIAAVFESWDSERAIAYRRLHGYSDEWGTAVVIQRMVFGNLGQSSCTGVLFTDDPSDGTPGVMGEFLVNAQGEDVVAGTVTPMPLDTMSKWNSGLYSELVAIATSLQDHYQDMMDCEFTVEAGQLYMLQCRKGKRTPRAAFEIAYRMYNEGIIGLHDVRTRITKREWKMLAEDQIDAACSCTPNAYGLAAGGGVVGGLAAFSKEQAIAYADQGHPVILLARQTTPDDFPGMIRAKGILTAEGGLTCHAAVVGRSEGKTCVVGCAALEESSQGWACGGVEIYEGLTHVTICGHTGRIWTNATPSISPANIPVSAWNLVTAFVSDAGYQIADSNTIDFANVIHAQQAFTLEGVDTSKPVTLSCFGLFAAIRGLDTDLTEMFHGNQESLIGRAAREIERLRIAYNDVTFRVVADYETRHELDKELGGHLTVEVAKTLADAMNGLKVTDTFIAEVVGGPDAWDKIKSLVPEGAAPVETEEMQVVTLHQAAMEFLA